MTYKTHISTGILFSTIYFLFIKQLNFDPILFLVLFFVTLLGASTPDLDTPTGGLWQKIPAGSLISRIVHPVFLGGHRHLSHSIIGLGLFTALFSLLFGIISPYSPIIHNTLYIIPAFVLGYTSHLFADSFTEAGVPLLFPIGYHFGIPPDPFGRIRIKTGRWFENLIVYPAVNIAILILVYKYTSS